MIRLGALQLKTITDAAEHAYPAECCGLLAGFRDGSGLIRVSRVVASRNVATTSHRDSFEVDPQVRFDLMRACDDAAGEMLVGHYHSHPDHPARPSARDLAMAYEPDLAWIIVGVAGGRVEATNAFLLAPDGKTFREIELTVEPWSEGNPK
jgi:proteasome lid subunit RPN8/RPN11